MFQKAISRSLNLKLNRCGIFNENDFLISWSRKDSSFRYVEEVLKMYTDIQKVGNKRFDFNWVFLPQVTWFNDPNIVFTTNHLSKEFDVFGQKFNIRRRLPTLNTTKKTQTILSNEASMFLRKMYLKDYNLWDYWSKVDVQDRIDIQWSKHESFSNRP